MDHDVASPLAAAQNDFFLARQPIMGRDHCLVAFELLYRSAAEGDASIGNDAAATAAVISHASQLGMESVVGQQLAFLNVDQAVLMSDFIRFLPADKVILEILETVRATPELLARIEELRRIGFKFALDDVVAGSEDVLKLMPLADVIKIDVKGVNARALPALARSLSGPDTKLLAEKVETIEQFESCLALGFDYFQGYYFARPAILSGRKIAPSELSIIGLLDLINSDAGDHEIEDRVKRDPLIGLNLLRMVNTPAAGAGTRIDSLGQALRVLGRRQLQRWLQILLYARPDGKVELTAPLLQMAATRGKLLELMTRKLRPGTRAGADIGFTVGVMSLMDALFSMSMADILASLIVADEVRDALLNREGEFGHMLRVAELIENPQKGPPLHQSLRKLGLTAGELNAMQLSAFEWVNELATELH